VSGRRIELVVFDCDGVLFDSERANVAFYNAVLAAAGFAPMSRELERACHALSSQQFFETFAAGRPGVAERLQAIAHELDYGPFYPLMRPRPGLRPLLARLRRRHRTAMATNRGKTVAGVLERFGLEDLFDLAVGVHDVARPKPHPDLLLRCLEHFRIEPEAAVYVGDQRTDLEAARAAGVRFVGMGPAAGLAEHGIDTLEELEPLLASFARLSRARSAGR